MADMALNLGPNILDKGKGKAPATDIHQHIDDSDRSRTQSCKTKRVCLESDKFRTLTTH